MADTKVYPRVRVTVINASHARVIESDTAGVPAGTVLESPAQKFKAYKPGEEVIAIVETRGDQIRVVHTVESTAIEDEALERWSAIGTEYVSPTTREILTAIERAAQWGHTYNMFVTGPSGYGKTSLMRAFAESIGYEFWRADIASWRNAEEIYIVRDLKAPGPQTVVTLTEFSQALQHEKHLVLVDEINRGNTSITSAMMSVLDFSRTIVKLGQRISVAAGNIIAATANIGYQYVGTRDLDPAVVNRFNACIEVEPPPPTVEVRILLEKVPEIDKPTARTIVYKVGQLREMVGREGLFTDVSTRTCLKIAHNMLYGMSLETALTTTVLAHLPMDARKVAADIIQTG